ncbi:AraC family transcriptional regulator [Ructibacterium gallinarum]|uniref:AraC family transcriptional regulator n=1 Tax=Ructibacterium gallinarum TaxID=2779355 RepID=A0A9D5R9F2_9FIRM|nr:AraC family transcriptional regulator [Ructibacterium gallinarum]MBE5041020.1 AraC family transcriptional regulator [Ructibacterium gallinarum]
MIFNITENQLYLASKKLNNIYPKISNDIFTLEIFWCRIAFSKNAFWNFKEHGHSFFELHIPTSDYAKYIINGNEIIASKGTLLLIPPHQTHHLIEVSDNFSEFVFGFGIAETLELQKLLTKNIHHYYFAEANTYIYTLIDNILKNTLQEYVGYGVAIENQLSCIFIEILQNILKNSTLKSEQNYNITNTTRVRLAINYINDNISNVTVNDIANSLHISTRQLNRIIQLALSMTTIELITDRRIRAAKKMMQDSDNSMTIISELVGFKSLQHFSKTFKKLEGVSPSVYKKDLDK